MLGGDALPYREVAIYPRDIRVNSPAEALIVEQALAMYREMKRVADAAPDGQVLDMAERTALSEGRERTRKGLKAVLNEQAQEVEKRGAGADLHVPRPAATPGPLRAVGAHGSGRGEDRAGLFRLSPMPHRCLSGG